VPLSNFITKPQEAAISSRTSEAHGGGSRWKGSDDRDSGRGGFLWRGSLAGQPLRRYSATALSDGAVMRIGKNAMMLALHQEHTFADMFVAYLLTRTVRYEADLVDQLLNSSEKRLACKLLLLAHFGKEGVAEAVTPKISQETLAEMVGTTRSRISFFLNRFRKLGLIDYNSGGIRSAPQ
jgi:CRP/FNR family cyclic AMP-dependent transcriptional regulator